MNSIVQSSAIPGMIEPIEQDTLRQLAKDFEFNDQDTVVEFGAFLGRSTACLAEGLAANQSFNGKLITYDSFQCDLNGGFYPHLFAHCKNNNVQHLIKKNGRIVDFQPVFDHYLKHYIKNGLVVAIQSELIQSTPPNNKISLMHIDSPKFYEEFKIILYRFFPKLNLNGYIIFQDFFYQWSASLIAVCGLLLKSGHLSIARTAASSLICKYEKPFTAQDICEIDLIMSDKGNIPILISSTIDFLKDFEIDRKELFYPRLFLAKFQWFFEQGKFNLAKDEFVHFFNSGGKINNSVLNDFFDLLQSGFTIRNLYDKDHNI
jgi:hypothetical protein